MQTPPHFVILYPQVSNVVTNSIKNHQNIGYLLTPILTYNLCQIPDDIDVIFVIYVIYDIYDMYGALTYTIPPLVAVHTIGHLIRYLRIQNYNMRGDLHTLM